MLSVSITSSDKITALSLRDTSLPVASLTRGRHQQILPAVFPSGVTTERHVYWGPMGAGYIEVVFITKGRTTIRNTHHHGPETYRDAYNDAWYTMVSEAI